MSNPAHTSVPEPRFASWFPQTLSCQPLFLPVPTNALRGLFAGPLPPPPGVRGVG